MNLYTLNKFLFIFWLTVAIASSIYGVYMLTEVGWPAAKMEVFLPCIAWAFCGKAFFMKRKLEERGRPE